MVLLDEVVRAGARKGSVLFTKIREFGAFREDFDIELIITDECDRYPVSVECLLAKHLARTEVIRHPELLKDKIDCFWTRCHRLS